MKGKKGPDALGTFQPWYLAGWQGEVAPYRGPRATVCPQNELETFDVVLCGQLSPSELA